MKLETQVDITYKTTFEHYNWNFKLKLDLAYSLIALLEYVIPNHPGIHFGYCFKNIIENCNHTDLKPFSDIQLDS